MKRWLEMFVTDVRAVLSVLPPTLNDLRAIVHGLAHLSAPGGPLEDLIRGAAALAWAKAATTRQSAEPESVRAPNVRRTERRGRWRRDILSRLTHR